MDTFFCSAISLINLIQSCRNSDFDFLIVSDNLTNCCFVPSPSSTLHRDRRLDLTLDKLLDAANFSVDDESVLNSFKSNCEVYDSIKKWRSNAIEFLRDPYFRGSVVLLIDGLDELESVHFFSIYSLSLIALMFNNFFLVDCLHMYAI